MPGIVAFAGRVFPREHVDRKSPKPSTGKELFVFRTAAAVEKESALKTRVTRFGTFVLGTLAVLAAALAGSAYGGVILVDLATNNPGAITLGSGDNTVSFSNFAIDYLIVAGGGSGGGVNWSRAGGGGGAGGLIHGEGLPISGAQTIVVGAGGVGTAMDRGTSGGNSVAFNLTAVGGGAGGTNQSGRTHGLAGGSGGGGSSNSGSGGSSTQGTPGLGSPGGAGNDAGNPWQRGGGGGGAGGPGNAGSHADGPLGGVGFISSITGTAVEYARGGDGGIRPDSGTIPGTPGAPNTGSGGGGGAHGPSTNPTVFTGSHGGSGIVVVRYSGPQVLTGGTVSTVGSDTVHQFTTTGTSNVGFNATIAGSVGGGGNLIWNGIESGTLTLAGNNTYTGNTFIGTGTLRIEHDNALGTTDGYTYVGTTTASGNGTDGKLALAGNITSAEPIRLYGIGNTDARATRLVNAGGANTLTGGISLHFGGGYYGISSEAGHLTVTSDIQRGTVQVPTGDRTLFLRGEGTGEIQGNIIGSGLTLALIKQDAGTWTLSGANTYTGATTVNEGTLLVGGSTHASSAVTVNSGGTLGGTGLIAGDVTVNPGGTLSPGTSTGLLTVGALDLSGNALFEINGTDRGALVDGYDAVHVNGALTYGGMLSLELGTTFGVGSYQFNLFDFDSQTGSFSSVELFGDYSAPLVSDGSGVWNATTGGGNEIWTFTQGTGVLGLTVVPEPTAWLLLLIAAACGLLVRRRK